MSTIDDTFSEKKLEELSIDTMHHGEDLSLIESEPKITHNADRLSITSNNNHKPVLMQTKDSLDVVDSIGSKNHNNKKAKRRTPGGKVVNCKVEVPDCLNKVKDNNSTQVETIKRNRDNGDNAISRVKVSTYEMADVMLDNCDFSHDLNCLFCYKCGYWQVIVKDDELRNLRRLIPQEYVTYIDKRVLSEIYEWLLIKSDSLDDCQEDDRFRYINFSDCAVDLITSTVLSEEERKQKCFRYALTIPYQNASKSNGALQRYLNVVFDDDKDTYKEFAKFFALAMGDLRNGKRAVVFYGDSNTGKSVMLNYIGLLVGKNQYSTISFSQFNNDFAPAQLLGKRLNLSSELSGASNDRLDIFKSLTGNDVITTSFKYQQNFQFLNNAMLIFAGNTFPVIKNAIESASILDRIIIFPFLNAVDRKDWIPHLEYTLYEDLGGTINFLREGVIALQASNGMLFETEVMLDMKKSYRADCDSFGLFMEKCLVASQDEKISSSDVDYEYRVFCEEMSLQPIKVQQWSQILKRTMPNVKATTITDTNGKRIRGYCGVKFRYRTSRSDVHNPFSFVS